MTFHARRALGPTLFILGLLLSWGPLPAASAAEFGIGDFSVRMLNAEGNPENRAGARPDRLQLDFALETEGSGTSLEDLAIEMPPGFVGDPSAVPACPRQAHEEGEECPSESQVGTLQLRLHRRTAADLPGRTRSGPADRLHLQGRVPDSLPDEAAAG